MLRFVVIATALAFLAGATLAAESGNPPQEGGNGLCLDAQALHLVDGISEPFGPRATVDAGSKFAVTHSGDRITLDFYDADDRWLTWNNERVGGGPYAENGTVPADAAYVIVCMQSLVADLPFLRAWLPDPFATWTYQDGF